MAIYKLIQANLVAAVAHVAIYELVYAARDDPIIFTDFVSTYLCVCVCVKMRFGICVLHELSVCLRW